MVVECARALTLTAMLGLAASACAEAPSMAEPDGVDLVVALDHAGTYGIATAGGRYTLALGDELLPGWLSLSGIQTSPDGSTAKGRFRNRLDFRGELIDFKGQVTCLSIDPENGRAWVGGVVTHNNSEAEPWASGEIYQPGKDIWFRVLDSGEGNASHGRTTFVGFEGGAGIITSAEYCETSIWPEGDARTWPVVGNVQVHP